MSDVQADNRSYAYPRPFTCAAYNPVERAAIVENDVAKGLERLYAGFSISPNFGGCVKAYAVGCNLRCGFCWSPCRTRREIETFQSRNGIIGDAIRRSLGPVFADKGFAMGDVVNVDAALAEIRASSFGPHEVVSRMLDVERSALTAGIGAFELCTEGATPEAIQYFTISGGEPTLSRAHLLGVLENFFERNQSHRFLLQTNGFLLGADTSYVEDLLRFQDRLDIRISLKAGSADGLLRRVGAEPGSFDLPFRAVEQVLARDFTVHLAAMSDPAVMPLSEREALLCRLSNICSSQGKRLRLYDTDVTPADEETPSLAESPSDVLLDEEVYVPHFPQIFARTLEGELPRANGGKNA